MINFDAVDFSERHPEEVISFFWRSVYITLWSALIIIGKALYKNRLLFCFIIIIIINAFATIGRWE